MDSTHVFISSDLNSLPRVHILINSLKKYHPKWVLHLAVPEEIQGSVNFPGEVHPIDTLEIPEWRGWAFCHNLEELSAAIKPFILRKLLNRKDVKKVIYFDPNIVIFSKLDDILNALNTGDIVLIPRIICPEIDLDTIITNEIETLKNGVYDCGFFGVRNTDTGHNFANWWSHRLYHFCREYLPHGLWRDQRWIDFVPVFFDNVKIIRTPRHNVAPWNAKMRDISENSEGVFFSRKEKLGFYNFSDLDDISYKKTIKKYTGDISTIENLMSWYKESIQSIGKNFTPSPWQLASYSDGRPITFKERLLYRQRVDLQKAFLNPFDPSGYLNWCKTEGIKVYTWLSENNSSEKALRPLKSQLTLGWAQTTGPSYKTIFGDFNNHSNVKPKFGILAWELFRYYGIKEFAKKVLMKFYKKYQSMRSRSLFRKRIF